jgi:hypothetical protein
MRKVGASDNPLGMLQHRAAAIRPRLQVQKGLSHWLVALAPAGQLTQFNMNGWNLGGSFPVDQLARFRALSEIDISNNPNMRADLKKMFDAFAQLQNLQVRRVVLSWHQASAVLRDDGLATTIPSEAGNLWFIEPSG